MFPAHSWNTLENIISTMNSEAGSQMKKRTAPLNFLNFVFFLCNVFFGINSDRLVAKGQKNKWHVGTTHGFAGFGLSKTVYFSGGGKKNSLPFATVQPEQLNCRGTEGKRSRIAAEPTQAALQAASGYWPAVRNWNGTESGPSSEFTETVSAIFFSCTLDWFVLSARSFGGGPCVGISHAWCWSELVHKPVTLTLRA